MSDSACPHCGGTENIWGNEIRGVYDGVLFWSCAACGRAWPRDFGDWERLNTASHEAVEAWMEGHDERQDGGTDIRGNGEADGD